MNSDSKIKGNTVEFHYFRKLLAIKKGKEARLPTIPHTVLTLSPGRKHCTKVRMEA